MTEKVNKKQTESPETENVQEVPSTTLLSSISYTNHEDYEKFLLSLTPEHAVIVLIAAANHSHSRGIFTLDESELVAKSIRKLSAHPQPPAEPSPTTEEK
jgi:hypothetical protein